MNILSRNSDNVNSGTLDYRNMSMAEIREATIQGLRARGYSPAQQPLPPGVGSDNRLFRGWQGYLRNLSDAYKPRPPVQYVVDGLFARGSLNIVYGAPGTLKSMLLADMCVCVAAGVPWLPGLPDSGDVYAMPTTQTGVLWVDYDNGSRRTDERIEALAKARDLPENAPLHYLSMAQPWMDATDDGYISDLIEMVGGLNVGLVVVDNLGQICGDADENSADMSKVMGNLRRLAEASDAAVIVIHHQRKGSLADRAGDLLRGHSSIEASLDLALLVTRDGQDSEIVISPTKVRDAAISSSIGAMFTYTNKANSRELETARFWGTAILSDHERGNAEIEEALLTVLRRMNADVSGVSQSDLVAECKAHMEAASGKGPGRDRIRGVLAELVERGEIFAAQGEHNRKEYRVA